MKNRVIHIVCSMAALWGSCIHAAELDFSFWTDPKAREVVQAVVARMHGISLLDGKDVFGNRVEGIHYCEGGLDNEWRWAFHQEVIFEEMFKNPVKSTGWIRNTYYTPEEVLDVYRELARRCCQLNPTAVNFFTILFEDGQIFGTPLPGFEKQGDRAKLFSRIHLLRKKGGQEAITGLTAIGEALAARTATVHHDEAASSAAPRDDDAAMGGATLRHRRHSPADADAVALHELSGDEPYHSDGDGSTESDPLLPKEE